MLLLGQGLKAQNADTLLLSINQADSLFLKKNYALLAARYQVSAADALRTQAKLYPNPELYVEQSLVNKYTRAGYENDSTKGGSTETIIQVQQLILLAGKRNKQVRLAGINARLAEADFENLVRTLRLQLHTDLSELYYNNRALRLLNEERRSIGQLSGSLETQLNKGYVSLGEIVRIKSLLLEIDKGIKDYSASNYALMAEVNTILGNDPKIIVKPQMPQGMDSLQLMPVTSYLDSAVVNNPELKSYNLQVDLAKAQHSLDKAMAVPDANLQFVYDKSGNYIKNYYGLGLGLQLPVWNRNQGNVRASRFQISQSETELKQEQLTVAASLVASYASCGDNQRLLANYREDYEQQLLQLMDNVLDNYHKRLIALNEFINYYEGYKQSYLSLLDIKSQLFQNVEQLNFLIGKPIIK